MIKSSVTTQRNKVINLKYQFIRRLLGISLSICTAYGAMRSAFVMAGTLDTTPGAVLVAEAKTEQTANIAEARADGTAASGEEVNEFVIEEISEDIEAIEDVEVNEDIEAVEDIDQEVDEDVLKEEAAATPDAPSGKSGEVFVEPAPGNKEDEQVLAAPAAGQEEEAQIELEPEPEEPDVTLDDFLAGLRCGACGRCCSLLNPHCRRGMHKAQSAEQEYYETYALS